MKRAQIYMSIFALLVTASARGDSELPTRMNFDRYKGMLDRSPFAVATAVSAPAAAPNFAKDLFVANAAKSPEGDMVTIGSSFDKDFKKYLTTKGPVDGYGIANIEWSDKVGETKVTISKDGQFGTLTFNQALLSQQLPNRPPAPPPGAQIQVQPNAPQPGFPKPAQAMPAVGTPPPHVRGVIQRNPSANQTPFQIPPPSAAEQ
jgi:hypothetical protein